MYIHVCIRLPPTFKFNLYNEYCPSQLDFVRKLAKFIIVKNILFRIAKIFLLKKFYKTSSGYSRLWKNIRPYLISILCLLLFMCINICIYLFFILLILCLKNASFPQRSPSKQINRNLSNVQLTVIMHEPMKVLQETVKLSKHSVLSGPLSICRAATQNSL